MVDIEEQWISRMSAFQLGLVPSDLSLYTLITYQFLHGGWGHIIGNLLFLFLLGFTVERALGPGKFLVAYLVCGALSGLVEIVGNPQVCEATRKGALRVLLSCTACWR